MLQKKLIASLIYAAPFYFVLDSFDKFVLFGIGIGVGLLLLLADRRLFYAYYNDQGQTEEKYLATRSAIFLLTLIPLSLFVITSTMSLLGIGLVMSLILNLIVEMSLYRRWPQAFKKRFLSEIAVKPEFKTVNQILLFALSFFVVLNILLVF